MIRGHRNAKRQRTSERSESSSGSSQEAQSRHIRSCTKVFMHGNGVGRGVDLRRVDSYEELFRKLEEIFKIEGQLCGSAKKWNVAYVDDKNDMMMVGDDPCHEFCSMVRKIFISPSKEVKKGANSASDATGIPSSP